ncbi:MAG: hypothetical protein R3F62_18030 [Planctomycetota bacterium]
MIRLSALAALALAAAASAQDADPGGRFEVPVSDLLRRSGEPVQGVGFDPDGAVRARGAVLSFGDPPSGGELYHPYALEVALTRLLGFDAASVEVDSERGVLRAQTSAGGRQRLERQLAWLRAVEAARHALRLEAYLLPEVPAGVRAGLALDDAAREALAAERPWLRLELALTDGVAQEACALVRERTFLADYEVNQTGAVPVLNPVQGVFREGLWVRAAISREPQGERRVLVYELGAALLEGTTAGGYRAGLPLTLPTWSALDARGSFGWAGAAQVPLVVAQDPACAGGRALVVVASLAPGPACPPPPDPAVVLRRHAWGALDRRCLPDYHAEGLGVDAERRTRILDALDGAVGAERWSDESFAESTDTGLVVCQTQAVQEQLARALQRYARSRSVGHTLVLEGAPGTVRLGVSAVAADPVEIGWRRLRRVLEGIERSAGPVSVRFEDPGEDPVVGARVHGTRVSLSAHTLTGLQTELGLERETLGEGERQRTTPWGTLTWPEPGPRWAVRARVRATGAPVVAAELRPLGGEPVRVTLDTQEAP